MTGRTTTRRPPVPVAALELVERSTHELAVAASAQGSGDRYVSAHLSALRSAAAVLATRGRPGRRGPSNVWSDLPRVAPELAEWAAFFAAGARRRAAVEAGRADAVTTREADDLLRDAVTFADLVTDVLGITGKTSLPSAV